MTRVVFDIKGMDCADEAILLRKTLGDVAGVAEVTPNVVERSLAVVFRDDQTSSVKIVEAIATTGMSAVVRTGAQATAPAATTHSELRRALLAGLGAAALLTGLAFHASRIGWATALLHGGESTPPLLSRGLYVVAIVLAGWFVAPRAWAGIRGLRPDMYVLMTIAVVGAVAIGEWLEAATVTVLFSTSLALEAWTVGRARDAIGALTALTPQRARVIRDKGREDLVGVESVAPGERVLVKTGEQIPLDGTVLAGESSVNQAPITGESVPVPKGPGDEVLAGTINHDGVLEVEVVRPAGESTLARVSKLVSDAQAKRSPSEQWVERFAAIYTPAVLALAALVAIVPPLVVGNFRAWLYEALSLLVIACPCALVISTPVSMVAALVAAARRGVLVKGGEFLERLASVRAAAFDKTGTLTVGRPEVEEAHALAGHDERQLLEIALSIERRSEHPLAQAIVAYAEQKGIESPPVDDYVAVSGKGAEARRSGRPVWVGSLRFATQKAGVEPERDRVVAERAAGGGSVVLVGEEDHTCGFILLRDRMRADVPDALKRLRTFGVSRLVMLTGDNRPTAEAIGKESGVDEIRAELLPAQKVENIEALVAEHGSVAMVGDGVNDAPALARASVGIAMGAAGSASALETADIALLSDQFSRLPWLLEHARRTLRIVRQNIVASLVVKAAFVALALFGNATLWAAIAADMGVSLAVVFNALRLLVDGSPSVIGSESSASGLAPGSSS
jgi:Cd2+/Zn2+-exporting ATPase